MLQNVMECRCNIHELLQTAEAATTECYGMIHRLIYASTFLTVRYIPLITLSTFRYIPVSSISM